MSELAHIGKLVAGKGPTFINDYEIYADRHFLRDGAPVEPAEYRAVDLPTSRGTLLVEVRLRGPRFLLAGDAAPLPLDRDPRLAG